MARVQVTIGGDLAEVLAGSLSIGRELRGRATCEFTLRLEQDGSVPPEIGEEVLVTKDGQRLFGGHIDSVSRRTIAAETYMEYRYTCTDWQHILDVRLAEDPTWVNTPAGTILTDLKNLYLGGEGFTVDAVPGPVIERFDVRYATVREAINRLLELTPLHQVVVTPMKAIRFFATASNPAPFEITSVPDTNNVRWLEIRPNREQLANRVIVHLGTYVMDARTETFDSSGRTGGDPDPDVSQPIDGTRKYFSVTYPIHQEPLVRVNGVPASVGIDGVETAKDWYWNQGSQTVRQDEAAAALADPDILAIEYVGTSETTVVGESPGSIAARAAIENRSGKYEALVEANEPLTRVEGQQLANALVEHRAAISFEASGETSQLIEPDCLDLEVGQLLTIERSGYAADGEYLVRSLRISDIRGRDEMSVAFTAVKGPITEDGVDFFRRLKAKGFAPSTAGTAVREGLVTIAYE
jgi:hypothetical protein